MLAPGPVNRPMARTTSFLVLTLALLAGSEGYRRQQVPGKRAFYYWRTQFALSLVEKEALHTHHVERLYLRLFDVAVDPSRGLAAPVAVCQMRQPVPAGIEVVPVVFIANRVFQAMSEPKQLAGKLWRLVRDHAAMAGFAF